jgi:AAA family ATP:ADP antiporter
MSELWSTAIMTVLFWGFANEITTVPEARRFYGILSTGANIAQICSGQVSIFLSQNVFIPQIPYGTGPWEQSMLFLNCAVILSGILSIVLFRWLNRNASLPNECAPKEEKIKMSMRKNFAYLTKSKYLLCIAMIVLTYNIAMNLIEIVWKNQIKLVYPDPSMYNAYMGGVLTATGIIATIVSVFVTTNIIQRFSWTFNALIPPVVTLATGALFFLFTVFPHFDAFGLIPLLGISPLYLSITFGSMQNCMTRACKYTLYDATKELAFIPLSKESKLKGKAAIDGVGSRLGKSGGSVIHQGFLMIFMTLAASTPYIALIFLGVVTIWVFSATSLGKQFDELTDSKTKLHVPEPAVKEPAPRLS